MHKGINHFSKLHKGIRKQMKRQSAKPEITHLPTGLRSYDEDLGRYTDLMQKFYNKSARWTALDDLDRPLNSSYTKSLSGMYAKRKINKNGKYELTTVGKNLLKKKKEKLKTK